MKIITGAPSLESANQNVVFVVVVPLLKPVNYQIPIVQLLFNLSSAYDF